MYRRSITKPVALIGVLSVVGACSVPTPSVPTVFNDQEAQPQVELALAADLVVSYPDTLDVEFCPAALEQALMGGQPSGSVCLTIDQDKSSDLQAALRRSLLGAGWRRERDEMTFEEFVRGGDTVVVSALADNIVASASNDGSVGDIAAILVVRSSTQ